MTKLTPLVMRFGAMGDMVLLIPMLKVLQQRYGQPCELVSSGPWTPPLMQRVPACGPVHLLTSRRTPYFFNRSQWQLVDALRQRPPGPVYVVEPDEKPLSLLRRTHQDEAIGQGNLVKGWPQALARASALLDRPAITRAF